MPTDEPVPSRTGSAPCARFGVCQQQHDTRKAPEAGRPGKRALHDPAARRQHEAALGLGQLTTSNSTPLRRAASADVSPWST